jgi:hypothetical protein
LNINENRIKKDKFQLELLELAGVTGEEYGRSANFEKLSHANV